VQRIHFNQSLANLWNVLEFNLDIWPIPHALNLHAEMLWNSFSGQCTTTLPIMSFSLGLVLAIVSYWSFMVKDNGVLEFQYL
jgi:hypothetical protein